MEKRLARAAFITHSCVASSLQCLSFIVVPRLINVARCIGDVLHGLSSERIKELSISMLFLLLVYESPLSIYFMLSTRNQIETHTALLRFRRVPRHQSRKNRFEFDL